MLNAFFGFDLAPSFIPLWISSSDIVKVKLSKDSFKTESGFLDKAFWRNSNFSRVYFVIELDFCVFWYSDCKVLSKDSDWFIFELEYFELSWRFWLSYNWPLSSSIIDSAEIMLLLCSWLLIVWDDNEDLPEELEDEPEEDFINWDDFFGDEFYPIITDSMMVISEESVKLLLFMSFLTWDLFYSVPLPPPAFCLSELKAFSIAFSI